MYSKTSIMSYLPYLHERVTSVSVNVNLGMHCTSRLGHMQEVT